MFGLVWSCDSGAYFIGRAIGRRKLHPLVSPGKTVEGYIGGAVTAALVTALLGWLLLDMSPLIGLVVGLVTAAIAQFGDLAKSMLKRVADRKDSATCSPGTAGCSTGSTRSCSRRPSSWPARCCCGDAPGAMTGIAILGSTGSIGRQTIDVVQAAPDRYEVRALAAGHGSPALDEQLAAFPTARVWSPAGEPNGLTPGRWADGGLEELATADGVELVVVATTGMTALPRSSLLAPPGAGRARQQGGAGHRRPPGRAALEGDAKPRLDRLRRIDSEHSAIWQSLRGERMEDVARLILTASGGPFRDRNPADLAAVTPAEALAHPLHMGPKITIDSATLVNKAFEAMEAKWLYDLPYPRIDAVLHPGSIVHSLVEFVDGSFKAQLGLPDMRLPINTRCRIPNAIPAPPTRHHRRLAALLVRAAGARTLPGV